MADLATLEDLCAGRAETPDAVRELIAAGRLPAASAVDADGTERFPHDYFALLDDAGSVEALRDRFEARYVVAADTYGAVAGPDELDDAWYDYLAGRYGARYLDTEPESAVRAARLSGSIERLLAAPAADVWRWLDRLAGRVRALAATLRPDAPGDDGEPGPYDRLVRDVQAAYPAAFADRAE